MRRASYWKSPIKKHVSETPLCALLLEYIPNSVSIAAEPARLSNRPHLVTDILDRLRIIHSAGVLHNDPMPRNVLLDENDSVWWIDFGWSNVTTRSQIHDAWFQFELCRVECLLLEDVIPAERKGIVPDWRLLGQ
jgi:serine/threonine protein kinase